MHSKIGPKKTNDESLRKYPSTFFLNPQDKEKLIESLKSPEIEGKLRALDTSALDPQSMVSVISTTLLETCSKANIKAKRKSSKLKNDDPWFDKDCKKLRTPLKGNVNYSGMTVPKQTYTLKFLWKTNFLRTC